MEMCRNESNGKQVSEPAFAQTLKLQAAVPELNELEETIVHFVGAEMAAGATREEIQDFCTNGLSSPLVHPRIQGEELRQLEFAISKVKLKFSANWKDFVEGYFEGAMNALEFVESQSDDKPKSLHL